MVPKTEKPEISDYQGEMREKNWLGSKDSNLDCMIQSDNGSQPVSRALDKRGAGFRK